MIPNFALLLTRNVMGMGKDKPVCEEYPLRKCAVSPDALLRQLYERRFNSK